MTSESSALTLAAFILRRRKEIDTEREPLLARLEVLDLESEQLDKAAAAVGILVINNKKPGPRPKEGTIKETVLGILRDSKRGMLALDILTSLNERNGSNLVRSSLSPKLSRLKHDGLIELTDGYWHLPGQPSGNENAPDQNLFPERSEGAERDPEAQGGKAPPGGGT